MIKKPQPRSSLMESDIKSTQELNQEDLKEKRITTPNFTQTPNVVFDYWMPILSGSAFKVLMCLCRKTFGWHKTSERISRNQLCKNTGMSNRTIKTALDELEKYSLIIIHSTSNEYGHQPNEYQLNVYKPEDQNDSQKLRVGGIKIIPGVGQKLSHIKRKNINKERSTNVDLKETPDPYKIKLTSDQKNKLIERMGKEKTEEYTEALYLHLKSVGQPCKYKCHYSTILSWYRKDETKQNMYKEKGKKPIIATDEKELMERIYNKYINEYRAKCQGNIQEKCLKLEGHLFVFPTYKVTATLRKLLELLFNDGYVNPAGFKNCASKELKEAQTMLKCDNIMNEIYNTTRR